MLGVVWFNLSSPLSSYKTLKVELQPFNPVPLIVQKNIEHLPSDNLHLQSLITEQWLHGYFLREGFKKKNNGLVH